MTSWMNNQNSQGQFSPKFKSPKSLRSMRLTEECWESLGTISAEIGLTRTDLIEAFAAAGGFKGIILNAIAEFLAECEANYNENSNQHTRDKGFSTHTRDYSKLMQFYRRIETGEFIDPAMALSELMPDLDNNS